MSATSEWGEGQLGPTERAMQATEADARARGLTPMALLNERIAAAVKKMSELSERQELWERSLGDTR
jgi:hypothetical protein